MKPIWSVGARQGELRRHKQLVFFACEGLIALYDERTPEEDYNILLPADFEERARELGRMGKDMCKASCDAGMREEGRIFVAGADAMKACVKEARDMGDPSDPAVQSYWARHQPGRKSTVSLSAGCDAARYPKLPEVALGKQTGRTAGVDGQARQVSQEEHLRVHRPPKKKPRTGLILDV